MPAICFQGALFFRALENRLGRLTSVIDYSGVTRLGSGPICSPDDAIVLTVALSADFAALAASCGLAGEPTTWGSLRGNHLYCERLYDLGESICVAPPRDLLAACISFEPLYPAITLPLKLFCEGKLDELQAVHIQRRTFEFNAQHYDGRWD